MSIAIGFQCTDGIVLAADSELSSAFVKVPGDKAWIYRYPKGAEHFVLQLGIVGAGDASFIQYASERINESIQEQFERRNDLTVPEVNSLIQGVVNDLYHSHLYSAAQMPDAPEVQLIIGMRFKNSRLRLVKTYLTSVTKVWNYEAVGIGNALANFIIKRFYAGRVTVSQAVFIASQVLMHVKENVPRCGGTTRVIMMYKRGDVGWAHPQTVADHEAFLLKCDAAIEPVFFGGADRTISNQVFSKRVDELSAQLKSIRTVKEIQDLDVQLKKDVRIDIPAGSMAVMGATGPTIVSTVRLSPPSVSHAGFTSGPSTPIVASETSKSPTKKPIRRGRKRDRKSRTPSQR